MRLHLGLIAPHPLQITETFDDMNLDESLLRGIFAYGFEKPSAIQQRGTLPLIKGRDTIAQAQSGAHRHRFPHNLTGKCLSNLP